jgi:hypothetical protein
MKQWGSTFIPNIFYDLIFPKLKPADYIVFSTICRKTIGYGDGNGGRKLKDRISYSQFLDATPYDDKNTIDDALARLKKEDWITVEGKARQIKTYGINWEKVTKILLKAEGIKYEPGFHKVIGPEYFLPKKQVDPAGFFVD